MDSRFIFLLVIFTLLGGCSTANMFKGPKDYNEHYYAEDLKNTIDRAIIAEAKKETGPPGHAQKPYSAELWNASWNKRIYHLYRFEKQPHMKAYDGPTGEEFILYIIQERRSRGLPELVIEERNKDRVS